MNNYSNITDEILIKLSSQGDFSAEETLAIRYAYLVRKCARPFFLSGGDREDLIQEGMLGLLAAIRSYKAENNVAFQQYAERCIKNRLINALRTDKNKKNEPLNLGLSLDDLLSNEDRSHSSPVSEYFSRVPEEQFLARESAKELISTYTRCLSQLENKILSLYLEGFSYQEIAERVNKPVKSVDNAIQRIRHKLAKLQNSPGDNSKSCSQYSP